MRDCGGGRWRRRSERGDRRRLCGARRANKIKPADGDTRKVCSKRLGCARERRCDCECGSSRWTWMAAYRNAAAAAVRRALRCGQTLAGSGDAAFNRRCRVPERLKLHTNDLIKMPKKYFF